MPKPSSSGSGGYGAASSYSSASQGSSRSASSSRNIRIKQSSFGRSGHDSVTASSMPNAFPMLTSNSYSRSHSHGRGHHSTHGRGMDSGDLSPFSDSDEREGSESRPKRITSSRRRQGSRERESSHERESHREGDKGRSSASTSIPIPIPRRRKHVGSPEDYYGRSDMDEAYKNISLSDILEAASLGKTDADYPKLEDHERPDTVHGPNRFLPPHIVLDRERSREIARSIGKRKSATYWR